MMEAAMQRSMWSVAAGGAAVVAAAPAAFAQQMVSINLQGVQLANGVNQTRSSAPNTVSAANRYHYSVDGMVHGTGTFSYLALTYPTATPLSQVLEALSPGSSAFLNGDFYNCTGTLPFNPPPQTNSGSTVVSGITVNYSLTLTFSISATGVASFSLSNVVLTPSALIGGLLFDSGTATMTRADFCLANCDGSTAAPILNIADFTCFLQKFAAGDLTANCDCSTSPPELNVADFTCFLQKFAAGCSMP
jgi:hypothetical protein